ncbi:MAG: DUF3800 domain-containing protein [Deltaproteobacteria bacterium]|nr:DUF3800 domain-containing protein [Deltaproteobacteria bacterium]
MEIFNVYCDESCHLVNDHQKAMVLGAIWAPLEKCREISVRLRELKVAHGLPANFEVKWTKVSPAKVRFYLDWMDYFFDDDDLHFRALIVPDKSLIRHEAFSYQNHDVWYYKMYFDMLKVIFSPQARYRIYLDIKDTRGGAKVIKLHEVLCNNLYDFSRDIIERVQLIHSSEVELLQLADLLIGAVSYANRGLQGSQSKLRLVERMKKRSKYRLTQTTLYKEQKVNLLCWRAQEVQE